MIKFIAQLSLFFFLVAAMPARGQQTGNSEQAIKDSGSNRIIIHSDPRLPILIQKLSKQTLTGSKSARGFRIQIYNGSDKQKAIATKIDFMHRYPGIPSYMTYIQPHFRVKIGNFSSRSAAMELYKDLSRLYQPIMIVPDIIVHSSYDSKN